MISRSEGRPSRALSGYQVREKLSKVERESGVSSLRRRYDSDLSRLFMQEHILPSR